MDFGGDAEQHHPPDALELVWLGAPLPRGTC